LTDLKKVKKKIPVLKELLFLPGKITFSMMIKGF